jgi:hypothetical protein
MVLIPHWPYMFERQDADSDAVRITRWTAAGPAQMVIQPGQLTDGRDVVDVAAGPDHPGWWVETSIFRLPWPASFTVDSPQDEADGTPFYLHGPGQATIFPQGPVPKERLAHPDALIAAEQTVLDRRTAHDGSDVIELSYQHDEEPWWQGHWTIPYSADQLLVITAQALLAHAAPIRDAADAIATSIERISA